MKREDWEEYMIIESDGTFPILKERLDEENRIECLKMQDELLEEICRADYEQDCRDFDDDWYSEQIL